MSEEHEVPAEPKSGGPVIVEQHIVLARIGNIQALMSWAGDGVQRRPVVAFSKVLAPGEAAPTRNVRFEMSDIAAIQELCRRLLLAGFDVQSVVFPPPTVVTP